MGLRRKKEYNPRRIWVLFDRESYHCAWADGKVQGVLGRFAKDLKFCGQRIRRGYCDEDLYSICEWFLSVVPPMLEQYRRTRHGSPGILGENYENEDGILVNDTCHEEWSEILDRMVFLFRESDDLTCQRKNPYEDEHMRVWDAFGERYGAFGEGLETPAEKKERERTGSRTVHFPSEVPEFAGVEEKYRAEEALLEQYRKECKDEAFQLFSKWFFHLWD